MEINMHRDITHTGYKAKALFEKGEESWLRKAEGFPKPLYPSEIATPEATEKQQAEREKCWHEEFFGTR